MQIISLKLNANWWCVEICFAQMLDNQTRENERERETIVNILLLWWILSHFIIVTDLMIRNVYVNKMVCVSAKKEDSLWD